MLRVTNLENSLRFYTEGLGFKVLRRNDYPEGKFTLVFLRAPDDSNEGPAIELTYNWGVDQYERGTAFGHVAYQVASIDRVKKQLQVHGFDLSWGPDKAPNGKTIIAFVDDPDGYEIELIQE
jgi:lactoylglutathione lyase